MNLGREGVFTMIYLGIYNIIRPQEEDSPMYVVAATSSFTGALAWIASYPFDTIKTLMQSNSKYTLRGAVNTIYQRNGITNFFVGCGSSTLRAILVTSSRLVAYEQARSCLGKMGYY